MSAWFTGALIGLIVYCCQILLYYACGAGYVQLGSSACIDYLIPLYDYIPFQVGVVQFIIVSGIAYILVGAFIGVFSKELKARTSFQTSMGVKFFGGTLLILPITNLAIISYSYIQAKQKGVFVPQYPAPEFDIRVFNFLAQFSLERYVDLDAMWAHFTPDLIETLIFIVLVAGILTLRSWAKVLLLAIACIVIVNSVSNLILFSQANPYMLIKNGIFLLYFTLLIFFFTHPEVNGQFRRKSLVLPDEFTE